MPSSNPGADLLVNGHPAGEVDLLGWRETSLFAGEAKSSAAGFEMADAQAEVAKAASVGADAFVAVSLEPLHPQTRNRLRSAAEARSLEFRVLDAPELIISN